MGEVRKLQKKLRQIENLEVKITLTPEERHKISKKAELRSRLADLLLQLSGPQQNLGIVGEGKPEKMKRQVDDACEAFPSPTASKISKGELQRNTQVTPVGSRGSVGKWEAGEEANKHQETGYPANVSHHCPEVSDPCPALTPGHPKKENQSGQEDAMFTSLKATWEKTKFRLRLLEGHSDIVTCVVVIENLVISGSRDTTVKVWHVPTATEQRNLGGHSGGVTCLCAPPPEYCRRLARTLSLPEKERFILSGSADSYVKIWALSTGQYVKSVYTFNCVTALCFVPEGEGYIITGSDGGKVQAWSWHTLENCQSINAHQDAVTSIQSQGPLVFSGCAEGDVSVWENLCSVRDPLRLLFHWTSQVTGCGGDQGDRLALSPRGDRVFLAYGRACIRILDWRTGSVSRLTNHSTVSGVTDCVHQTAGLLIGSCYDLASGESTLNVFSLPQCRYLVSLTCAEVPRVLCFAMWLTGSGDHRWVTGGRSLIVWEQLPRSTKQRGDVTVRRDSRMEAPLSESENSTDDDEDEESDDYDNGDDDKGGDQRSRNATDGEQSSWFRCVLQ